jgi:hypothetical protein
MNRDEQKILFYMHHEDDGEIIFIHQNFDCENIYSDASRVNKNTALPVIAFIVFLK